MGKEIYFKLPEIVDKTDSPYDEWIFDCFFEGGLNKQGHSISDTCKKWRVTRSQLENIIRRKIREKFAEYEHELLLYQDRIAILDFESFSK